MPNRVYGEEKNNEVRYRVEAGGGDKKRNLISTRPAFVKRVPDFLPGGTNKQREGKDNNIKDGHSRDDESPAVPHELVHVPGGRQNFEVLEDNGGFDEKNAWAVQRFE